MSEDSQNDRKGRGLKEEVEALRDEATELLGGLRQIFSSSRDEIVRSAALGRLRVDIYQQKKERSALVLSLGEQVHAQAKAGELKLAGLSDLLAKLDAVEALIAETQEKIDAGQIAASEAESPVQPKAPVTKKTSAAKKTSAGKKNVASSKAGTTKKSARASGAASSPKKTKKSPGKKGASKTAKGS